MNSDVDDAVEEEEEATISADASEGDTGQSVHDDLVVKTLQGRTIQIMKDQGVVIKKEDVKIALQLFPWVSLHITLQKLTYLNIFAQVAGHAHHIHDGATLKEKFDKFVQEDDELEGSRKVLDH
jgi:hypothetical protein